ncbi:MAG: NUDIX domain-containing protein [Candidatus Nanosalina sp.]
MAEFSEKPTEVATAVAYDPEKQKFLLLKRNFETDIHPGKWNFPGGRIENEQPVDAALRELEEETGLKGEMIRSAEPFTIDTEDGKFKVHPFLILVDEEPELNQEHLDSQWIEPEELDDFETVDGLRKDLKRVGAVDG